MWGERLNVGVGAWVVAIRAVYAWGQGRFVWPQSGLEPVWIERHGAGHSHGNAGLESGAGLTAMASGYPTGIPLPETGSHATSVAAPETPPCRTDTAFLSPVCAEAGGQWKLWRI